MLAEEASKNEAHFWDTLSDEGIYANEELDDEEDDSLTFIERCNLAEEIDEDDNEEDECCICLKSPKLTSKVDFLPISLILSDNEYAGEIPPKMVSWEEFSQQMGDYKRLSTMFKELVIVGKGLEEEVEKYKLAQNIQLTPYDAKNEKEIKILRVQVEESALREEHLKEILENRDKKKSFTSCQADRCDNSTWDSSREEVYPTTESWQNELGKRQAGWNSVYTEESNHQVRNWIHWSEEG